MKILFIYKFLTLGGVETVLRARLEGLSQFGIEGTAWFLREMDGRPIFNGMDDRIKIGPIARLHEYLLQNSFDVISSIDTEEILDLLGAEESSSVYLLESHSPYVENLEYLRTLPEGLFDAILIPSRHQLGQVQKRLPFQLPLHVVPNPLGRLFAQELRSTGYRPPFPIVAWVGRLDALKDWRAFLSISARVANACPQARFWVAGRIAESGVETALYAEARRLGILKSVRWFRNLPHDNIPAFLDIVRRSGGVYLSSSGGESFGMTVAEAMARACPTVAPRLAPITEYLSDGENGRLYRRKDWREAAMIAGDLLRDPSERRRLGGNARMSILAQHGSEIAVEAYARLLRRIVRDARMAPVSNAHRVSTAGWL